MHTNSFKVFYMNCCFDGASFLYSTVFAQISCITHQFFYNVVYILNILSTFMFPIKYLQVNIPYISIYIFTRLFIPTQHGINNLFLSSQKKILWPKKNSYFKKLYRYWKCKKTETLYFCSKGSSPYLPSCNAVMHIIFG